MNIDYIRMDVHTYGCVQGGAGDQLPQEVHPCANTGAAPQEEVPST
jgi:hypothetical protein